MLPTADYMAAGRPTVLAIEGVIRDIIERFGGGVLQPGDDRALAEAIIALSEEWSKAVAMWATRRASTSCGISTDTIKQSSPQLLERVTA